jgi:hypothetical protein
MRQFTIFTFLYLAAGVFLTAISFKYPDKILMFNAGFLYVLAILSTFLFWPLGTRHSQDRMRNKPAWWHNFVAIAIIVSQGVVVANSGVFDRGWTIEVISKVCFCLPIVLLSIENIFSKNQIGNN